MRARKGLTMVELMVAMTILSVVLLSMSGLFMVVSRRTQSNDSDLQRAAYIAKATSILEATPFASLSAKAGTDSTRIGKSWMVRTVTVADSSATRKAVTLTVTDRRSKRKEVVKFERTLPTCTSVLNTIAGGC